MNIEKEIILASSSPRRRELMRGMGLQFDIIPSDVNEEVPADLEPAQIVEELAFRKASDVARSYPDKIVIGSDTVVVWNGTVLGKPRDEEEAFQMLSRLQGDWHRVYTGLAVIQAQAGIKKLGHTCTRVQMKPLSPEKIKRYISSGEPMDKAGAYAIQGIGATLVQRLDGDYFTVVGLPVSLLADYLESFSIEVP